MDDRPESINIAVKSQDGREKHFKIKQNVPICKLLNNYCDLKHLEYQTVQFLLKGKRFDEKKTPAELNLKDGVLIEAFMHVDGGGGSKGF